ncbi:MAG: FAD-dependent oxidoreductase [Bacteroidota bacterium]
MNSYWEHELFLKKADFVVIGGGIVGINAALTFKTQRPRARVVLLERGILPTGASTRNAGFACFGSPTELLDDLATHTEAAVWDLVQQRWEGLQRMRAKLKDTSLHYRHYGGYEVFRPSEQSTFEQCVQHLDAFNAQLERITGQQQVFQVADERISDFGLKGVQHLILSKIEGQLHPARMMQGFYDLAKATGVVIFNGFDVQTLHESSQDVSIRSSTGISLKAAQVLVATNGFARQLLPDLAVTPARNQVLITAPIPNLKLKGCFHYDRGYIYFRNVGNRILLGGGRNLAAEVEATDQFGHTATIQNALQRILQDVILPQQNVSITHWWSGILGVGERKQAILKKYSTRIGVAVRMGGMGVAIGTAIGEKAAQLLLE